MGKTFKTIDEAVIRFAGDSGDGMQLTGRGAHTDIVVASAMAFINALNRLQVRANAISPQTPMKQVAGI